MAKIWTSSKNAAPKPKPKPKLKPRPIVQRVVQRLHSPSNPLGPVNLDLYKTQSASVQDISKKYGIDYTREYAARQAEATAQAKRTGLQNQSKQVDLGVRNAQDAMSRDYFQKGLETAQSNVNGGMNQGLANEANLRLSMNRQAQMGDVFRQANLQKNEVQQNLTNVEVERKAQEEQIYQQRLEQAIAQINQNRQLDQSEKQMLLQAALQQRDQAINQSQFDQQLGWNKYQFNNMSATDKSQLNWNKYQFNNMSATDKSQLNWNKYQFNNMSASDQQANKLAWAQLEQDKKQFATEQQWREYTYRHMSATEKLQLDEQKRQFGEDMAWKNYEMTYTSEMALAQSQAEAGYAGDLAGIP